MPLRQPSGNHATAKLKFDSKELRFRPLLQVKSNFTSLSIITVLSIIHVKLQFLQLEVIFRPLKQDAALMAHRDPSDITNIPIRAYDLWVFTTFTLVLSFLAAFLVTTLESIILSADRRLEMSGQLLCYPGGGKAQRFLHSLVGLVFLSCGTFVIAILSGASPFQNVAHTFAASLNLSSIAFAPILARRDFFYGEIAYFVRMMVEKIKSMLYCGEVDGLGTDVDAQHIGEMVQGEEGSVGRSEHCSCLTASESVTQCSMYFTVSGVVVATILVTLDWGAQCQRWPVPILLGSIYGHCCGSFFGLFLEWSSLIWKTFPQRGARMSSVRERGTEASGITVCEESVEVLTRQKRA